MYGVFPYIYHKQINHSCRYIYIYHTWILWVFPKYILDSSDILDEYPKVFFSVVSFYPSQQSWLKMIIPHLQATDLVMLRFSILTFHLMNFILILMQHQQNC